MSGDELKRRREDTGLTQEQFGELLGVTQSAIQHWETRGVPRRRLRAIEELITTMTKTPTQEWDSGGVLILSWR